MPPAPRAAALAAALLVLGTGTGCSLLAAPDTRTPGNPAPIPPKQVVLAAAQAMDDAGGARIEVVREGPGGRRTASGTLVWGARDEGELAVTDEAGTGRLALKDGEIDLAYQGGAAKHADRSTAESLDAGAAAGPDGYAGGWTTALISTPGNRAYAIAQKVPLGSLGGEQLAGTTVAHYQGTASVDEFFGTDQELSPQRRSATVDWYRQHGVTAIGFDVWVGPGERLLRLRETVRGSAGTTVTTTDVPSIGTGDPTPSDGG
ncbi:hypothetical protein GCM10018790_26970 [Kitasatospora xanthocidica]|uniref:hypothetical protein n=1 Tax=Kitasatospora xanthocidica TaxID=83382 RepID=UPI00167BB8EF|nr:hypothetical protein [Kitasatospora xanthocidica]GHF47890.1 hypothetical protein GCM10018790_26970 [Kitasatospora xanthocidica]